MSTRHQYTEDRKAEILAVFQANGQNAARTAAETGVPRGTLRRWIGSDEIRERAAPKALRQQKEEELAQILERVANRYSLKLDTDQTASETKGRDAAVVAGIAIDKLRLLRNQPTAITAVEDLASLLSEAGYTKPHALEDIKKTA